MEPPQDLLAFMTESPTPAHAVRAASARLEAAGFDYVPEASIWDDDLPAAFYTVRNAGSLVAVRSASPAGQATSFRIALAHDDFPGFRLKPRHVRSQHGYSLLSCEIYGSPILATWFDRDLSIAGAVFARTPAGDVEPRLYRIGGPACRISTPALHLNRGVNEEGFTFNKEENLLPMAALDGFTEGDLAGMILEAAGVEPSESAGWTAHLVDAQPPAFGGLRSEFILAGGLDNLAMSHAATMAIASASDTSACAVACIFDNEEVGSGTASGAGSRFLDSVLRRMAGGEEALHRAAASSIMVSVDGAHALHPCYESKHDRLNRPLLNGGPVIKSSAQERYATSALTASYLQSCAAAEDVPLQYFASRNDIPCGSTVGPMVASRLGMLAVDAGDPMLSMHSIRECAGTMDHGWMTALLARHLSGSVPFRVPGLPGPPGVRPGPSS